MNNKTDEQLIRARLIKFFQREELKGAELDFYDYEKRTTLELFNMYFEYTR